MSTADDALILFPGALGDFICFLPTLSGLRDRHRGRILLLARPALLDLVPPGDVETASIDRREVTDLFVEGSSLAPSTVDLFGGFASVYSWTGFGDPEFSRRLSLATSASRVQVLPFRGMQLGEHAVAYYRRCAGLPSTAFPAPGIAEDAEWLTAREGQHHFGDGPLLVMHPGSGAAKKNWEGFSAVARYWRERFGDAVILLHGPVESEWAMAVEPNVKRLAELSLPQVAALLRRCQLYLGNDSGVSHLAGAVGTSGVVVFGPTDPTTWAPQGKGLRVLHAPKPCPRCGPEVFCVHRLPPEPVIDALRRYSSSAVSRDSAALQDVVGGETPLR